MPSESNTETLQFCLYHLESVNYDTKKNYFSQI